jgi:hypothetical protein
MKQISKIILLYDRNEFILLLRIYWPTEDLFNDDGWIPPELQKQAVCIDTEANQAT